MHSPIKIKLLQQQTLDLEIYVNDIRKRHCDVPLRCTAYL